MVTTEITRSAPTPAAAMYRYICGMLFKKFQTLSKKSVGGDGTGSMVVVGVMLAEMVVVDGMTALGGHSDLVALGTATSIVVVVSTVVIGVDVVDAFTVVVVVFVVSVVDGGACVVDGTVLSVVSVTSGVELVVAVVHVS